MYTVSELRLFVDSLDDSDVSIGSALTFMRDAVAFTEQPLSRYSRAWLETQIGRGASFTDHQLILAVTASIAVGRRLPLLLRAVTIAALDSGYSADDILYDALARACQFRLRDMVGALSDFVRGRSMVSEMFLYFCGSNAVAARMLHDLGAECSEESLAIAIRGFNVDTVRMHMECDAHDACFLAPKMLLRASSGSIADLLLEFVPDAKHTRMAEDFVLV